VDPHLDNSSVRSTARDIAYFSALCRFTDTDCFDLEIPSFTAATIRAARPMVVNGQRACDVIPS